MNERTRVALLELKQKEAFAVMNKIMLNDTEKPVWDPLFKNGEWNDECNKLKDLFSQLCRDINNIK